MIRAAALLAILTLTGCTLVQQGAFDTKSYGQTRPAGVSGANGNGTSDDYMAIQLAIDATELDGGGVVELQPGVFNVSQPLRLPRTVSLKGGGREATIIRKTTTNAKPFTIHSGPLTVYPGSLPSALNAVLVLDGAYGRYIGSVSDLSLEGHLASSGNYESHGVDFGIVSTGSVSESSIRGVVVHRVKYGIILPVCFASMIVGNRFSECLTGFGVDNGTSLTYQSNYANNCRDVGHFLRGLKYSTASGNACDWLNDPAKYPARTRTAAAYRLRSLFGCTVESNGDEYTFGRSYWLETLDNCRIANNGSIGLGSDYTGSDHIAWIYSDGILRSSSLTNNGAYATKSALLIGPASASLHHNLYFERTDFAGSSTINNNQARTALSGHPVEAGWGNNVTP